MILPSGIHLPFDILSTGYDGLRIWDVGTQKPCSVPFSGKNYGPIVSIIWLRTDSLIYATRSGWLVLLEERRDAPRVRLCLLRTYNHADHAQTFEIVSSTNAQTKGPLKQIAVSLTLENPLVAVLFCNGSLDLLTVAPFAVLKHIAVSGEPVSVHFTKDEENLLVFTSNQVYVPDILSPSLYVVLSFR